MSRILSSHKERSDPVKKGIISDEYFIRQTSCLHKRKIKEIGGNVEGNGEIEPEFNRTRRFRQMWRVSSGHSRIS